MENELYMDKFMFAHINGNRNHWAEDIKASFEVPEDSYTIASYHRFCKRFGIAMGYSPELVEEYFGETVYED